MLDVPIDHSKKSGSESPVQLAPSFTKVTTVAPFLWWKHAVPIVVNIYASVPSMSNIALRYSFGITKSIIRCWWFIEFCGRSRTQSRSCWR